MEEDQEICRVCRCESTVKNPLYHPCKCSGSIRFVHQDCLLEWLSHSKKKYCELCEHPFLFTPIYRQDMPNQIPIHLLTGQGIIRCGTILKSGLRALIVTIVWLILLPYMTLWSWRFYFWSNKNNIRGGGDDLFSGETSPSFLDDDDQNTNILWEFLVDCFKGQVITLVVIVIAATMYIFREWVAQNVPMETESEQIDLENEDVLDNETTLREHTDLPPEDDLDADTISALTRQLLAVDALIKALDDMQDGDTTPATNGKTDIRRQLEDLQQDLQHELNKFEPKQRNLEQSHPLCGEFVLPTHSQQDDHDKQDISNTYQLGNDEEDENQVEDMMHSIMIQDQKNAFKRYSWDDLQNSSKTQHQQLQFLYPKRDSPGSSPSLPTSTINKGKSTSSNLSSSHFKQCESTLAANSEYHLLDQTIFPSTLIKQEGLSPFGDNFNNGTLSGSLISTMASPSSSKAATTCDHTGSLSHTLSHRHKTDEITYHPFDPIRQDAKNGNTNCNKDTRTSNINDANDRPALDQVDLNNNILNDDDDEEDEEGIFHLGNDIDGVFEAIGMRGSPWILLQNSILVFIVISVCLGVAVWLPYTLGRLIILVRPIGFTGKTMDTLRTLTDPVVDYILDHGLPLLRFCVPETVTSLLVMVLPRNLTDANALLLEWSTEGMPFGNTSGAFIQPRSTRLPSISTDTLYSFLGERLYVVMEWTLQRWYQIAVGKSALDQGICILFGYFAILSTGSWYLARHKYRQCTGDTDGRFRRAIRTGLDEVIRQQCILFKVTFFMLLERIMVPIACGVLVDVAVGSLDKDVSIRWELTLAHPWCGLFLYWFVGRYFMSELVALVDLFSEIVRPGAMLFICNLNRYRAHSIQDIMEHSPLFLLSEICAGALVYLTTIGLGIGTVAWMTGQFTDLYPLNWLLSAPLSTLAIDLLAAQFLFPILASYMKPRESFKQAIILWWQMVSHQLRLSSFMFGVRYAQEEGVFIRHTLKSWVLQEKCAISASEVPFLCIGDGTSAVTFKQDGQLVRVPKRDTGPTMIIPVDPVTLLPLDPVEERIGHSGEEESLVVYVPPHLNIRLGLFLILMWLSGSAMVCFITVAPVLLGRAIFAACAVPQIHDFYAFTLGACICILAILCINGTRSIFKRHGQVGYNALLRRFCVCVQQKALAGCKVIYMMLVIGWVAPLLLGVAVDLYVFTPLQCIQSNQHELVLHLSKDWSFGVIYLGVMHGIMSQIPTNGWKRAMDQYILDGLESLDVWTLTRNTLGPWALAITGAITLPGGLAWMMMQFIGTYDGPTKVMMFSCAYPIMLCMATVLGVGILGMKLINLWMRIVKDDAYLVGKQLHNLDDQPLGSPLMDAMQ